MRAREGGASISFNEIASTPSLSAKKSFAKKIFGLNLLLQNQKIQFTAIKPYDALRASRENFIEKEFCTVMVRVYSVARTYFIANS